VRCCRRWRSVAGDGRVYATACLTNAYYDCFGVNAASMSDSQTLLKMIRGLFSDLMIGYHVVLSSIPARLPTHLSSIAALWFLTG
jgi:hypothetical protein